ncbi:MAG: hypothetical protein J6N70_16435 [Oribacterium sp.]|nr:hypothetical protein [Oribacterium sp.]
MTIQEFTDRTGFAPTESYYHSVIEPEYMASNIEKDAWCKQWKRNGGIQKAYDAICKDATDSHLRLTTIEPLMKNLRDEKRDLRDEIKILREENESLRNDRKDRIDDRSKLMYSLIGISERYSSSELRELIINEIGFKAYIAYKLENDMNIWQLDKDAIIDNLK